MHCNDGLSCVASLKKYYFVSITLSFPQSFLASLPPRGIFLLTGGAVKFDWLSSGFDAVTSHPLRVQGHQALANEQTPAQGDVLSGESRGILSVPVATATLSEPKGDDGVRQLVV